MGQKGLAGFGTEQKNSPSAQQCTASIRIVYKDTPHAHSNYDPHTDATCSGVFTDLFHQLIPKRFYTVHSQQSVLSRGLMFLSCEFSVYGCVVLARSSLFSQTS